MRRRPIAFALLLWYLPACTAWYVEERVSPQQLITAQHPTAVRVTLPDGSRIILGQPRIAPGDSLAGVLNGAPSSVAFADVTQVAMRKISAGRTVLLLAGIAVLAALAAGSTAPDWGCCVAY